MGERPGDKFWGELRARAAQRGVAELAVRFRKDTANSCPAKLSFHDEGNELRLSPAAVAAWDKIDLDVVKKHNDDDRWEANYQKHRGAERLSVWQACAYLYGPLYNPTWSSHSYNPLVQFVVLARDAQRLVGGAGSDDEWVSLADLKELILPDDKVEVEGPSRTASTEIIGFASAEFPKLEDVAALFGSGGAIEKHALHNVGVWTSVHGSLRLLGKYPHKFDPREDYWWLPERRLLVVFFAQRYAQRYLPADALRRTAHAVFVHFDQARKAGRLGGKVIASEQAAVWDELLDKCDAIANELPAIAEYATLRKHWSHLKSATVRDELTDFLKEARNYEGPAELDKVGFVRRMPWFPYLGLPDMALLASRQMFFAAYHRLFTNTNSYLHGGSMGFAPVLQNNPTETLLGYVRRWTEGESLDKTKFDVEGRDERADRGHYNVVVELYGFLNLHKQPFHNNKAAAYEKFAEPGDESVIPQLVRIGEQVRSFVAAKHLGSKWATHFRNLVENAQLSGGVEFEGIRAGKKAKDNAAELADQVDARFERELRAAAVERARALSDDDAAATLFHLLLDAYVYSGTTELVSPPVKTSVSSSTTSNAAGVAEKTLRLPASLEPVANDALAMLRAGFHVLFAGAPGTGKTTAAQFVGHAWNNSLERVETQIPLGGAPLTTVGNSAWAPFHTIGGILPDKNGQFVSKAGIFVDPKSVTGALWRLRDECIVLDEMNRADLDRCIGELYPLLSRSVDRVTPAGIPGVETISACDRFRIVATVNDANLDDVVFPISEGLARRFIRIELAGARSLEIVEFLSLGEMKPHDGRLSVAAESLGEFFQHCRDHSFLVSSDLGEHLPFGVGYFGLFRAWCCGALAMSPEFSELSLPEQARRIVRMSLRAATKERKWEKVFRAYEAEDEEA